MGQSQPLFCLFSSFQHVTIQIKVDRSVDGVLGIRTHRYYWVSFAISKIIFKATNSLLDLLRPISRLRYPPICLSFFYFSKCHFLSTFLALSIFLLVLHLFCLTSFFFFQCDQMAILFFQNLAILNNEKSPKTIKHLPK